MAHATLDQKIPVLSDDRNRQNEQDQPCRRLGHICLPGQKVVLLDRRMDQPIQPGEGLYLGPLVLLSYFYPHLFIQCRQITGVVLLSQMIEVLPVIYGPELLFRVVIAGV